MKYLVATFLSLLLPAVALAEPVQVAVPTRTEAAPLQYMQSCMPGPLYSAQFTSAIDAKVVAVPGTSVATYPYGPRLLLKWGSQWKVSCDANGAVLACLHQALTPTISLGAGNDGGDGAGYTSADSTYSSAGQARCIQLTAATPTDFFKVSPASFGCSVGATARDPLTRCGRCSVAGSAGYTVGAPCRIDADCGSGTCDTTNRPDGVFLSFVPVSASSVCYLSRCAQ